MSGVEVVEAVRIAASVVKNSFLRGSISSSLESVAQGSKLHTAFNKLHIFEPLFISMIQIGEEASMLPDTFQKMADLYEAESNDATQKMTAVLEPIMTMSIGLVIALLVISIILPMFDMYSVVLQ
jgi:type IV pilus assembly protein PilC